MKTFTLIFLTVLGFISGVGAQERIYRCGNEYTNKVTEAQARSCKLVSGGNVTVVQGHKPAPRTASTDRPAQQAGAGDQQSKDSDRRLILETEIKQSEARLVELLKEYNNGEPEKLGPEARNFQKYQDRIAELKASIKRTESDIAGIRRELSRVPTAATPAPSKE